MPENEDTILDNALAPKKVTGDEGSVRTAPDFRPDRGG
jgi:hypothetical protein